MAKYMQKSELVLEATHAEGGCAVATVWPVAALWETSMKPLCLGLAALVRFVR
jgi:hypothetical protein